MRGIFGSSLFYLGLFLGILGSAYFAPRAPVNVNVKTTPAEEAPCPSVTESFSAEEKRDYQDLKAKRTNLNRPPTNCLPATTKMMEAAPPPAKPKPESRRPISLQTEEPGVHENVHPGQSEDFPFSKTAAYKTTMCEGESGWFVSTGFKSYFAAEPDPDDEKSTNLVGTIVSSSLQRSELTLLHCLKRNYKSWRIRIHMQIKTDNVRNGRIIVRRWNPDGTEGKAHNQVTIAGTYDWKNFSLPIIVAEESFAFGVEMIGSGKISIKNVKVVRDEDTHLYD